MEGTTSNPGYYTNKSLQQKHQNIKDVRKKQDTKH